MDLEKKRKAMAQLKIQANYINWEKGLQPKGLLKEISEPDMDFEKAFELLKINKSEIIDIGCGWGNLTMQVAQMGHRVLGVDVSEKAVQYAKEKALRKSINCDFRTCDIIETEFNKAFDVVMDRGCFAVMDSSGTKSFMEKINHLLKPEGYFLLKMDKGKLKTNPKKMDKYTLFFKPIAEWEGTYLRSDEKEIKAMFYIGQKITV